MGAIPNSSLFRRLCERRGSPCLWVWFAFGLAYFSCATFGQVQTNHSSFAARAEKIYRAERQRFQSEPTNSVAAWQFARACFDWVEYVPAPQRPPIAEEGITAARQVTLRTPALAAGHYYLAMNLGRLADTKRNLAALRMVGDMEAAFKLAAGLDAKFDFAGADRGLGLLYRDAPGWPVSVGNKSKARAHLQRAVELSPESPENRLCLIEALLKWGDKKNIPREVSALEKTLPAARAKFTGEEWTASWADWDRRWNRARRKSLDLVGPSPRR